MAMNGIRDLSIIATPPAKRLSIKTFVRESDEQTIKEAVLREILRGGQVYFYTMKLKPLKNCRRFSRLNPRSAHSNCHGQMREQGT